jgi:hypothetical protein
LEATGFLRSLRFLLFKALINLMKSNQTKPIGTSMFRVRCWMLNVAVFATAATALADVRYVDVNSTNATPPYTNWTTAATNIQDAVDAAVAGDEIVVTNGTYATGGRDGNRMAVDKPLRLRSVNGPQFTTIAGGGTNRCAYLTNNASLVGFTLINGSSPSSDGGGVLCESASAVVSNCVLTGNKGTSAGGGAYGGTLNNCSLSNNTAGGFSFFSYGGGAAHCTLNNCTLTWNSALRSFCNFGPCGSIFGGGAYACTLNNCTLTANSPGGADSCTLNNCTLTGNYSGATSGCRLTNCIVYFNGWNYDASCSLNYCCTTPLPTNGVGNISSDPELASPSHLSAFSPCIGKGSYGAVSGDIDGEPWANPPSIGCDEYHAGAATGPLSSVVTASLTNVVAGYPVVFTALIEGRTDLSIWEFGDGALEINQPYTAHSWAMPGDYLVSLWAFNDSYPGGVSATVTVRVGTGLHYVAVDSTNPVAPYTSWATAATNIQEAINACEPGAEVIVTNGTYSTITAGDLGLSASPPPAPIRPVSVRSVNGPLLTIIDGGHAGRCASLGDDASLSGFTLTNGLADCGFPCSSIAGGVYGGTLSNCVLSGNSASYGGAAAYATLNHCILIGNSAADGGGAYGCTLNNCTVVNNSVFAYGGGGAKQCMLNNCIVYFNVGQWNTTDNYAFSTLNYCCTMPSPTNGLGNITNAPLFVDANGWANLRLQSTSPCINAGNNSYVTNATDLDGNPRIAGGTVDIGAYEFQSPVSMISYAWLQQFNLPINPATDTADPDGDGVDNWHEWLAVTDPTNPLSSPAQLTITPSGAHLVLTWPTNAFGFTLQSTTSLVPPAVWSTNSPAPVVIAGQNTVTNPITGAQKFYRLVQ